MTTHELKCWPEFFGAIARGEKTFEVRKNDCGFQKGDRLRLLKCDPNARGVYCYIDADGMTAPHEQAATVECEVTYVLSGWGIEPGYVCMGIKVVQP